jgi:hypothetical protein
MYTTAQNIKHGWFLLQKKSKKKQQNQISPKFKTFLLL